MLVSGGRNLLFLVAKPKRIVREICAINLTNGTDKKKYSTRSKVSWNQAILKAEDLVNHSSQLSPLTIFMKKDLTNLMQDFMRLIATPHPFLRVCNMENGKINSNKQNESIAFKPSATLRKLLYDGKYNLQIRSLIILLLSKMIGPAVPSEDDDYSGISVRQRTLANLIEMIHAGQEIHGNLLLLSNSLCPNRELYLDLNKANQISVLAGDYLMSNASLLLGHLREPKSVELTTMAMAEFCEASFFGKRDIMGRTVPTDASDAEEWEKRAFLGGGNLLANGCKSAMILGGHGKELQDLAYNFAKHTILAKQIHHELDLFVNLKYKIIYGPFNLTALPVILHLQKDPMLLEYIQTGEENLDKLDFHEIHKSVVEGPSIAEAKSICEDHIQDAVKYLEQMPGTSDCKSALHDIVTSLEIFEEEEGTNQENPYHNILITHQSS